MLHRSSDGVVYQRRNQLCGGSGRTLYERRSRTGCTVESNRNRKENIKMMGVLYGVAVVAGIILY